MTVYELIEELSNCNGNAQVRMELGEYADGVESVTEFFNDVILR